jgi:hypothetical protein
VDSPPEGDKKGTEDASALSTERPTEQAQLDVVEAERNLWNLIREIYKHKGINLDEAIAGWIAREIDKLSTTGARRDFEELRKNGCHPWVLAAILGLFRRRGDFETSWAAVFGDPRDREARARALESAAVAIQEAFLVTSDDGTPARNVQVGKVAPDLMASELRTYARLLGFPESIKAELEVRSFEHVLMLVLASYVKKATDAPHHGLIAGILSEVLPDADYTMDAQKQWYHRNSDVIESAPSAFSICTDFLLALSQVLPSRT